MKLIAPSSFSATQQEALCARDVLALSLAIAQDSPRVVRDGDGNLKQFQVLKVGINEMTMDGHPIQLLLTADDLEQIHGYHTAKGVAIPLDCEHFISLLASKRGMDETDLLAAEPMLGEKAAGGLLRLVRIGEGENMALWARVQKMAKRAEQLLSSQGDKLYGYFSPALRGLVHGPLRMTAVSLTNNPALNNLDLLAATGERQPTPPTQKDTRPMKTLLSILPLLAAACGADAALFTEANAPDLMERAANRIKELDDQAKAFLAGTKDALMLTEADTLNTAAGKLLALAGKAKGDAALLTDLQGRVTGLEAKDRTRFLDDLAAEGKLTPAMREWANKQDMVMLTDWAKTLSVVAPGTRAKVAERQAPAAGVITDTHRQVAAQMGLKPEQLL